MQPLVEAPMMALLPLLAFAALALFIAGRESPEDGNRRGWVRVTMAASVAWGAYLAFGSELLGAFGLLNRAGVALWWAVLLAVVAVVGMRRGAFKRGLGRWRRVTARVRSWPKIDQGLAAVGMAELMALLAIALAAAPNNADSLLYHMARVGHWIQNGSLAHYASSYHHQNWSPIWTETAILHLSVLWGGDRLAALVQWSSLVLGLIGVAGIARQLGLTRRGQLLAAASAGTAPMVVLQATSTQNDLAVGLWAVASAYFLLRLVRRGADSWEWAALGVAVGLGMLTKVTFYPYLGLALVGAVVYRLVKGPHRRRVVGGAALAGLLAVLLNVGFWSRNMGTYGTPLGAPDMVQGNLTLRPDPRAPLASGLQHAALNYALPAEGWNEGFEGAVDAAARWLGDGSADFEIIGTWNHEDRAPNPLHFTLAALAILVSWLHPKLRGGSAAWYAVGLAVAFLCFAWSVDHGVYRVRYQVPFLLLAGPLVGAVVGTLWERRVTFALTGALLVLVVPWVLVNRTRPVLPLPGQTRTGSVFLIARRSSLFANFTNLEAPYSTATAAVRENNCRRVGLSLDPHVPEYGLWWLLDAPFDGAELRVVRPLDGLEGLRREDFEPCAVLCTNCGQAESFEGLPFLSQHELIRVYLESGE